MAHLILIVVNSRGQRVARVIDEYDDQSYYEVISINILFIKNHFFSDYILLAGFQDKFQ